MKKQLFFSILIAGSIYTNAQNFSLSAKSGDTELDASLTEINVKAKADLPLFKNDLALEFHIGEPKINKMFELQMSPADVYMTFQIAEFIKKDPEVVATSFTKNKDKGWGAIAKEMGIKPGSAEFHALKGKAKNKNGKGSPGKGNGNANKGKGNNDNAERGKGNPNKGRGKGKK